MTEFWLNLLQSLGTAFAAILALIVFLAKRSSDNIQISARLVDAWFSLNKFEIESEFADHHAGLISGENIDPSKITRRDVNFIHCYFDVVLLHFVYARDHRLNNDILQNVLVGHMYKIRGKREMFLSHIGNEVFPMHFVRYLTDVWNANSIHDAMSLFKSIKKYR